MTDPESGSSRRRPDPGEMTPRQAKERYLRRRRSDATEKSVDAWHGRLKLFVEWCEGVGISEIGDLKPYDVNEYFDVRSGEVPSAATVEGEMYTLKKFCEFLEQLGAVDGLAEKVPIPDVSKEDRSSDVSLSATPARALLDYYRSDEDVRGTRAHVYLELAWFTGARQGGLRALDVRDFDEDRQCVEFHHREGTPLKNRMWGQRAVGLPEAAADAVAEFVDANRYDVLDDLGRQPLLASRRGRPTSNTVRVWSYLATLACQHGPCPHGKERPACEWTNRNHASKCPSTRSPHQIRTGSITWQLNQGIPIEVVSQRVNASPSVITDHYDKPGEEELWRRYRDQMADRRDHVSDLHLNDDS